MVAQGGRRNQQRAGPKSQGTRTSPSRRSFKEALLSKPPGGGLAGRAQPAQQSHGQQQAQPQQAPAAPDDEPSHEDADDQSDRPTREQVASLEEGHARLLSALGNDHPAVCSAAEALADARRKVQEAKPFTARLVSVNRRLSKAQSALDRACERKAKAEAALKEAQHELEGANEAAAEAERKVQGLRVERQQELESEAKQPDPSLGQAAEHLLEIIKGQLPSQSGEAHRDLIASLGAFVQALRGGDPSSEPDPCQGSGGQGPEFKEGGAAPDADAPMDPPSVLEVGGSTKRAASSPPGGKAGAGSGEVTQPAAKAKTAPPATPAK